MDFPQSRAAASEASAPLVRFKASALRAGSFANVTSLQFQLCVARVGNRRLADSSAPKQLKKLRFKSANYRGQGGSCAGATPSAISEVVTLKVFTLYIIIMKAFEVLMLLTAFILLLHFQISQCKVSIPMPSIPAVVNEPVILPCESSCFGAFQFNITDPRKATIACFNNTNCKEESEFKNRFKLPQDASQGNFTILISQVTYNDAGSFVCICDGKIIAIPKLKVFVPLIIIAHELDNITLPCYGHTRKYDADTATWKKGRQNVLQYDRKTDLTTFGNGFEDRFAMSSEHFTDGDLSLHITSVRPSDAGLYLCSFREEFQEGQPPAILLKVERRKLLPPPPPSCDILCASILSFFGGAALVALVALLCFVFYIRRQRKSSEETVTLHSPVQEGERDEIENKLSSTRPIL